MVNEEGGQGYLTLFISFGTFLTLTLLHGSWRSLSRPNYISIYLSAFLIYFSCKTLFESMDLSFFKRSTVGTTGGVLFGLALGNLINVSNSAVYQTCVNNSMLRQIFSLILFFLLLANIWSLKGILMGYLSDLRIDIFLTREHQGNYQRAANFLIINFLILASLIVLFFLLQSSNLFISSFIFLLLGGNALFMSLISQLIGSNAGLVVIIGLLFVFLVWLLTSSTSRIRLSNYRLNLNNLIFNWIGQKAFLMILLSVAIICSIIYFLIQISSFDASTLRITGYGSGNMGSIRGRIGFIESYFVEQLGYNFLFGHIQVDHLTTGQGTYIHSIILSVQTHLGFFGLILFIIFNRSIFKDISFTYKKNFTGNLASNNMYAFFRLCILLFLMIIGSLAAFFLWLPYWFSVGAYANFANNIPKTLAEKRPVQ